MTIPETTVQRLKRAHERIMAEGLVPSMKHPETRHEVFERFKTMFAKDNLPELKEDDFRAFLRYENNRHWQGLERLGPMICSDMDALRDGLTTLLYGTGCLATRYDESVGMVKGMGKAVATAILLVGKKGKHGVWNNTSEKGLQDFSLWPDCKRGTTDGTKYVAIDRILHKLADRLDVSLWVLDGIWWGLGEMDAEPFA